MALAPPEGMQRSPPTRPQDELPDRDKEVPSENRRRHKPRTEDNSIAESVAETVREQVISMAVKALLKFLFWKVVDALASAGGLSP